MKVNNYAVAMNAQYFNLQYESVQAKISNTNDTYQDKGTTPLEGVEINKDDTHNARDALSRQLSKGVLQNISNETKRQIGDRLEINHTYAEAQALNYSVKAFIQADGKEIELSLDVSLSRSFVKKTSISIALPKTLTDPLVISLDGGMPSLSSKTFAFDIDSDGKSDQISQLKAGNGFLALDKNDNGRIDNGSELFGTKSGDGFADLKYYDDDNNGWIDENDEIFDKLRIWQGGDGEQKLLGLGEVGIGAIFLGNTKTPFSLKDDTNQLLGEIKSSSFVLYENGSAGVISQVDLAVSDTTKENLDILEKMRQGVTINNLNDLYNRSNSSESTSNNASDDRIQRLQGQIKTLEGDLQKADESEKPPIQARIGALYAQIMNVLEQNIS